MPKPTRKIADCLSVRDVADRIRMSEKSVRRFIEAGELRAHRFGAAIRISEDDLAAFTAARRR